MVLKKESVRWTGAIIAVFAIVYVLTYMPTPFVVYKPGLAEDVGPMVQVHGADVAEDSVLMLTTVRQMYPNWATYVYAQFNPNWDIYKKSDIFREGETRNEYVERQSIVMLSSQSNAIQAAYQAADIPFDLTYEGVIVLQTIEGMPASEKLQAGDRILEIEGKAIERSEEVIKLLASKKVGEQVKVRLKRNDQERDVEIEMGDFASLAEATDEERKSGPHPGLGIQPADRIAVKAKDPQKEVKIKVKDIGGPSAGLIFSLEIYDQLTPGDLTKGYRIAGTGEILPDGTVDAIGGVQHKISAADREGADIFFAPEKNARDAKEKAESIGTGMKVVSVSTLQDALDYLEGLPEQSKGK